MAKRKNHTNHNQNRKDHRNGIKRPRMPDFSKFLGLHPLTLMRIAEAKQQLSEVEAKK